MTRQAWWPELRVLIGFVVVLAGTALPVTGTVTIAAGAEPLLAFPAQSAEVPWPTKQWPTGPLPAGVALPALEKHLEVVARPHPVLGQTRAVVIVQGGRLVLERYLDGFGPDTALISWSVAKSITQALVGIAVRQGLVDIDKPMGHPRWPAGDRRAAIPWRQWINMVDGQAFHEIGAFGPTENDSARMLFGEGRLDVAGFAAALPLIHPPGTLLELQLRRGQPDRRCPGPPRRARRGPRRAAGEDGAVHEPRAVAAAGHDVRPPAVRRHRHLHGQRPVLRDGARLRPLRAALPARRRLGGPAPAARGLGRLRPHQHRRPGRRAATAPAGGSSRPTRPGARAHPICSAPRATRGSSSSSCPPRTSSWSGSACSTTASASPPWATGPTASSRSSLDRPAAQRESRCCRPLSERSIAPRALLDRSPSSASAASPCLTACLALSAAPCFS